MPVVWLVIAVGVIVALVIAWIRPGSFGLVVASAFLVLGYLSLQVALRFGFDYDLAWGHVPPHHYDGAPVLGALGALAFLAMGGCLITLVAAIWLLVRARRKTRVSPLMLSTVLIPVVLLHGVQRVQAVGSYNARHGIGMDTATLTDSGARYALQHTITVAWGCAPTLPQQDGYIDHPAFRAGCELAAEGKLKPKRDCDGYYVITETRMSDGRMSEQKTCVRTVQ
jgi:hypothetical protein